MAEVPSRSGGVADQVSARALRRSTWISGIALLGVLILTARGLDSIGFVAAGLAAGAVLGYWASLTSRLYGSIRAAPPENEVAVEESRFNAGMTLAGSAPENESDHDRTDRPGVEAPRDPDKEPVERTVSEAAKIGRHVTPAEPVAFDVPKLSKNARRTPLLDAETRAAEAMKRFPLDPSHTLSKLAELNRNFAPSAHVLQALAICLHRTGNDDQAVAAARQAFPLCFEHGYVSLAVKMFYEFRGQLQRLDLQKNQVIEIAKLLQKADKLAAAAKAYALVIHTDPSEYPAVKGLLDVADGILDEKKKPAAALKVYMFLLEHCDDSAITEIVRDGIRRCADAEEIGAETASACPATGD